MTPGWDQLWPLGRHMNKVCRGPLGDATYQSSMPTSFREEFWNFPSFFLCLNLWLPGHHLNKLVEVHRRCYTHQISKLYAFQFHRAEPHSLVGSVADRRPRGRWFDPRLDQYSFHGLMIVIATGFIPLSPLSIVSTMVKWESSQWLEQNIVRSTG